MTRNNARIIAKYLREAGWSEVTTLRQELAAGKARVQEMGRHNATKAALDALRDRMEALRRDQNALRERMAALLPDLPKTGSAS